MSSHPRFLHQKNSLGALRTELVYTAARLEANPLTEALAGPFNALIKEIPAISEAEQEAHDNRTRAQAKVHNADDRVNDLTDTVYTTALTESRNETDSPLIKTLFGGPLSRLQHYILGRKLEHVRPWGGQLAGSAFVSLQALAATATSVVAHADQMVSLRREADVSNTVQRTTGARPALFDKANALRTKTDGALGALVDDKPELRLPRDFPSKHFMHGDGHHVRTLAEIDAETAETEAHLADLRVERARLAAAEAKT